MQHFAGCRRYILPALTLSYSDIPLRIRPEGKRERD
jgi:hypothetical protein